MKWIVKLFKYLLILGITGVAAAALIIGGTYLHFKSELPSTENIRQVQLQVPLRIYSADHQLIAEYGEQRRLPVTYEEVPEKMRQAFLAAEDHNFFHHMGVDPTGLARAAVQLAITGERSQGGSTITMQVARNFYLSSKRTYTRKIREIFLAMHIENELSKQEILELYLNKIYLGHRAYGIGAAAQVYYGKTIDQLSLAETAMVAGLPKAPSKYNPVTNPDRALLRRNYVINRMRALGDIDDVEADAALAEPVTAMRHHAKIELAAPYMAEMARKHMVDTYGAAAYTSGYHVYTTLSGKLQPAADEGLAKALETYDRRHGWRGAQKHIDELPAETADMDKLLSEQASPHSLLPAIVTEIKDRSAVVYYGKGQTAELPWAGLKWARAYISEDKRKAAPKQAAEILQEGDIIHIQQHADKEQEEPYWRLAQIPAVSGAFVSLNPINGAVLALVGGYNYYSSKFNRVIQAKRQPGSGFKPIIYSAALEAGYTAASLINDAPVVTENTGPDDVWRPNNYSGKFYGPTRLRLALTKSRNLVSIRILRAMGVSHLLKHARNFGFNPDELPRNLSLALGSGEATPLQMARAYSVLANGGYLINPFYIQRIENDHSEIIYEANPVIVTSCEHCPRNEEQQSTAASAPRTISPENRYIMYSMMQDVITRGTATKARVLGRRDLAGKTGTTNEQRDAWFNGYNQSIVANVWVGFDKNHKLGRRETGGKVALPAWIHFMQTALQDIPDKSPKMPSSMVTVRIDKTTGERTNSGGKNTMFEIFRAEHAPEMVAEPGTIAIEEPAPGNSSKPAAGVEELF